MEVIYKKIWDLAKPYYEKGRQMDIPHIEWMMERVEEVCQKENIDKSVLMPLAILHDVGYSELHDPANTNYYKVDVRRAHMKTGAIIGTKILNMLSYPKEKIDQIIHYISIHDNWAFGEVEIFIKDKLLGTFKDLDYLWIYTKVGCTSIQKTLKKSNSEMLSHLRNEKTPIFNKKPFSTIYTKRLREKYLKEREDDYHEAGKNR